MSIKVCIMTSAHPALDIRIYQKQAISLARAGYDVTLLNNEKDGTDENGIKFVKVNSPKGRIKRILFAPSAFIDAARKVKADIYHFHDPELAAKSVKLLKYGKVIYDSHEDTPRQILSKQWVPKVFRGAISRIFEKREKSAARKFSAVVTATPVIEEVFIKNGCKKTITANNYPLLREFGGKPSNWSEKENYICYVGGVSHIRGVVEAVSAMKNADARIIIAGTFDTQQLREQAVNSGGWDKVDELGFVDRAGVAEIFRKSKAGLVTYYPEPNHVNAQPNKLFEYMAAGIAVIASDFPLWRSIVEENGKCGICVDPFDEKAICDAVNYIMKNDSEVQKWSENARKKVLEKYNWEAEEKKLLRLYKELSSEEK